MWSIEKLSQSNTITINQQDIVQAVLSDNTTIGLGDVTSFLFSLAPVGKDQDEEQVQQSPLLLSEASLVAPLEEREGEAVADAQREDAHNGKGEPHLSSAQHVQASGTEVASFTAMGIPSLEVTDNTTGAKKKYPLAQKAISIGRDSKNDIVIDAQSVSDLHLQIVHEGNQWILLHPHPDRQQTRNGLLYQGQKIQGNESLRKPLTRGDMFRIDDEYGTLVTLTYNDGSGGSQKAPARIRPISLTSAEIGIGRL